MKEKHSQTLTFTVQSPDESLDLHLEVTSITNT